MHLTVHQKRPSFAWLSLVGDPETTTPMVKVHLTHHGRRTLVPEYQQVLDQILASGEVLEALEALIEKVGQLKDRAYSQPESLTTTLARANAAVAKSKGIVQ